MKHHYTRAAVAATWVVGTFVAGASAVTSLSGWALLTCVAILPPLAALRWRNDPAPSLSEIIHKAWR